jgi:hypothetical protein
VHLACAVPAAAQTVRFPSGGAASTPPSLNTPSPAAPITAPVSPYGGAPLTPAPFDPYSSSGSSAYSFWGTTPPQAGSLLGPTSSPYGATTPLGTSPLGLSPLGPSPLGQAPGSFPTFGPPAAPPISPAPQYIFPNGVSPQWDLSQSIRFIQDVRFRHTYVIGGNDPNDLGINDSELATTFTIPNFLTTGQPLFISPAFALHLWDGPTAPLSDLPPSAYSAYLDAQWASDPALQLGAELGFRIGA